MQKQTLHLGALEIVTYRFIPFLNRGYEYYLKKIAHHSWFRGKRTAFTIYEVHSWVYCPPTQNKVVSRLVVMVLLTDMKQLFMFLLCHSFKACQKASGNAQDIIYIREQSFQVYFRKLKGKKDYLPHKLKFSRRHKQQGCLSPKLIYVNGTLLTNPHWKMKVDSIQQVLMFYT